MPALLFPRSQRTKARPLVCGCNAFLAATIDPPTRGFLDFSVNRSGLLVSLHTTVLQIYSSHVSMCPQKLTNSCQEPPPPLNLPRYSPISPPRSLPPNPNPKHKDKHTDHCYKPSTPSPTIPSPSPNPHSTSSPDLYPPPPAVTA